MHKISDLEVHIPDEQCIVIPLGLRALLTFSIPCANPLPPIFIKLFARPVEKVVFPSQSVLVDRLEMYQLLSLVSSATPCHLSELITIGPTYLVTGRNRTSVEHT